MNRRSFLHSSGVIAGGALLGSSNETQAATAPDRQPKAVLGKLPSKPNIVIFISDQQRATMHFPEGWEEENLPTMTRLKSTGLSFNRAYCSTAMCSPSRSALFTGLYPAQTGVTQTLSELTGSFMGNDCAALSAAEVPLSPNFPTLATVLKTAGYRCFFKGKWHLTKPDPATEDSLLPFGFEGWDPPDAGQDTNPLNAAGGPNQNDERYVSDALNFIENYNDDAPFLLVVSLVNPHDLLGYPGTPSQPFSDFDYPPSYLDGDVAPPVNNKENLANAFTSYDVTLSGGQTVPFEVFPSFKPSAHLDFLYSSIGLGPLITPLADYNYINFYANLIKKVDNQFGEILRAMDDRGFTDKSLVFRMSDHGEHGTAHGGLRQKSFTMYEEALRVPMVVSNPQLYQGGFETDALISLIDMVPTIGNLVGAPNMDQYLFKGTDMSPIVQDPSNNPPQTSLLFTYDDIRCGQCLPQVVPPPNRLRALITDRYKYCRYFDGDGVEREQYEMYDLKYDQFEMNNVANDSHPRHGDYATTLIQMREKLANAEATKLAPLPTYTPQVVINDNSGDLSISWTAEAGVAYQVQYSEDLETWTNTGDVIINASGGEETFDVTSLYTNSGESMFFRIIGV